jgi:hypothetical protein
MRFARDMCNSRVTGVGDQAIEDVVLGDYAVAQGAKTRFDPCRRVGDRVLPLDHIGSGMLRGLADADAFAVVTAGEGEPGSTAEWIDR